ncbi:MAG: Gfo/Idh/MocA family oxidoreductase [Firmicutes bacterium]|nr:Gfo/Idh/MocA family oxidoreductase [Bacillota bacterium]
MRQPVGVAVIGGGRAGRVHARNFRYNIPGAELVAIVDSDPAVAADAAKELELQRVCTDVDAVLEDPSVHGVVVTTPTFTHEELVVKAARAGKHILCEKPMALTLDAADRMIQAARETGVHLQMAFMRRFSPEFRTARQQLQMGIIGELMQIRSLTRGPGLPPAWAWDEELSNGMVAEVNSHDFDAVRWLTGCEFSRIYAEAVCLKAREVLSKHSSFYDNIVVTARLEGGVLVTIDGSCPVDYGYDARMEILGTRGVLFIGDVRSQTMGVCTRENGFTQRAFDSWRNRFQEGYLGEDRHFVDCIRGLSKPEVTGEDGRRALQAVLAVRESLRTGKPVDLRSLESGYQGETAGDVA